MSNKPTSPIPVRMPADLREYIEHKSTQNRRSLNGEILHRLEASRRQDPPAADYRPHQGTSVAQLKAAAKRLGVELAFETRTVSDAAETGFGNAIRQVRGWWAGKRYLGRNAEAAYGALPEEEGGPFLCSDHIRSAGGQP